jgi:hypothetical protein
MHGINRRILGIIVGVTLLVVFGPVAMASAATTSKPYSLTIAPACQGLDPQGCAAVTYETTSGEVASGETVPITAMIKNETTTQQLGSANLFAPAEFSLLNPPAPPSTSAGTATVSSSCTYNGAPKGACIELRNLSLPPGGTVTVTVWVHTPACQQGSNFAWYAEVKQANNYSGLPGNDFSYDATSDSQPDTTLDGACYLQFIPTQEPAAAQIGATISSAPYMPGGLPLAVQVLGETMQPLTTSTVPVTMSTGTGPLNATLSGDKTQQAAPGTGIATFADLSLSLPSLGCDPGVAPASCYTLVATSGQLLGTPSSPATSTPFDIEDQAAPCPQNASCTTTDPPSGVTSATLVANASSGAGELVESLSGASYGQTLGLCGSYKSMDPNVYESAYTRMPGTTDRSEVDTITFVAPATSGNPQQVLKAQQICFGEPCPYTSVALCAPWQFTTASGSPAGWTTLPNGQILYVGLLPTCTGSTAGPCHNRQQDTTIPDKHSRSGFDIVLVDDVPVGYADDPYRM